MKTYKIILRDQDGFNLTESEAEGKKAAVGRAKYFVSERFANACESTHEDMRTAKADILDESGALVEEIFRT